MPSLTQSTPPQDPAKSPSPGACVLCGARLLAADAVEAQSARLLPCSSCGLVRRDPSDNATERPASIPPCSRRPDAVGHLTRTRAQLAALHGQLARGHRTLELGCGNGATLNALKALLPVEVEGLEQRRELVEQARQSGLPVESIDLERFEPLLAYHLVLAFHVLDRHPRPLELLMRINGLLVPGGRVLLEVPTLEQPASQLAMTLAAGPVRWLFDAATARSLARRAGFRVVEALERRTLVLVLEPAEAGPALPLDWTPAPFPRGSDRIVRLRSAVVLERARNEIMGGRTTMELIDELSEWLSKPGFPAHVAATTSDLVEHFVAHGMPQLARLLIRSALSGPHDPELKDGLRRLATVVEDH